MFRRGRFIGADLRRCHVVIALTLLRKDWQNKDQQKKAQQKTNEKPQARVSHSQFLQDVFGSCVEDDCRVYS
jgi:hypothetical protein